MLTWVTQKIFSAEEKKAKPSEKISLLNVVQFDFTSAALYPHYGPVFPLQPSVPCLPSVISMALCILYSYLSPLHPYVPSTALFPTSTKKPCTLHGLCPLYYQRSPLQPNVPTRAQCPRYGPMSPLRPSASSTALYLLKGHMHR